ncbi:ASCH domain-containing protein [Clostridium septicum]|nr:ASCH domain-containing protein [Clostridium septicum]UEC19614.1 ASCH domain-containing protein [Clostridium septicum]
MKLNEREFENILFNNKILEVRLNDKKRRNIKPGDKIVFHKKNIILETIKVKVIRTYEFRTFNDVYSNFQSKLFGYPEKDKKQMLDLIYSIYTTKEEMYNGVKVIKFYII